MAAADMSAMLAQNRSLFLNAALAADGSFGKIFTSPLIRSTYMSPRSIRASEPVYSILNSRLGKAFINSVMRFYIPDEEMTYMLAMASMAKFACSDNAMKITSRALELMGADDSEDRRWVEKCFRDAKLCQIYEGTNQLNRLCYYASHIGGDLTVEVPRPFKSEVV